MLLGYLLFRGRLTSYLFKGIRRFTERPHQETKIGVVFLSWVSTWLLKITSLPKA